MSAIPTNIMRREQLAVIEKQMLRGLPGPIVTAIASCYLFWDKLDSFWVACWGIASVSNSLANWFYLWYTRKHPVDDPKINRFRLNMTALSGCIAGIIWSFPLLSLLDYNFSDVDYTYQFIYFSLLVIGLGAGALGANAPYLPTYYFFIIPFMLVFWYLTIAAVNIEEINTVGWVALFYFVILTRYAHTINSDLKNSIRMRFANKILADEYREQKERAEKSDLAKSRFLAAASHDLRQPLQALGFYADALQQQNKNQISQRLVNGIYKTTESLRSMLNVILDLSKIQSGTLETHVTAVPVATLLDDVYRSTKLAAEEKNITLRVMPSSLVVNTDYTMVTRVLLNLVSNAIRYTNSGRVVMGVRRRADQQVEIQVWDTGVGIAAEHQQDIFEEYFQVKNQQRDSSQGLGLGLSIVKGLLNSIGSDIYMRSVLGKGSCFSFVLPGCDSVYCDSVVHSERSESSAEQTLESLSLLLIDDDRDILDSVSLLLSSWGCEVKTADSPAQVQQVIAEGFYPQVVLSDLRLPDQVSGIEVMNQLRQQGVDFYGVLITGDTAEERLQQAKASGYTLLHKPLKPARLRLLLNRHQQQRENIPG